MYKLLVVSDKEEVLEAFDQIHNWDMYGFHKPHYRRDAAGAKECLVKHHADGIAIALTDEAEEAELMAHLRENYPMLPIFEAGRTPAEALEYLGELRSVLNRVRADFSSDCYDERAMMVRARRHFFRGLVSGKAVTQREMYRKMRLLRSRMDPDKPCIMMNLINASTDDDEQQSLLQDRDHLLEKELFNSFGGDVKGFHVLPLVTKEGKVFVLAGTLRDQSQEEDLTTALDICVREGIQHAEEYRGLHLRVTGVDVLPSLYALCSDYTG